MTTALVLSALLLAIGAVAGYLARGDGGISTGMADGSYRGIARSPFQDLTVRTTPHLSGYFVRTVQYGNHIAIACAVEGETIAFNDLSSPIWYRLVDETYTQSIYVDLVGDPPIPTCDEPPPEPPTGLRDDAVAEVRSNGESFSLYDAPDSEGEIIRSVPDRSILTLTCHLFGELVDGSIAPSDLWYRTRGGGYAHDGSLLTGSNAPVVEEC